MNTPVVDVMTGPLPTTLEGEPLDHNCLHCQLALPVQHFIERHPDKSREDLIREACEVVAELVASCGPEWSAVESYGQLAVDALKMLVREKHKAHDRYRRRS